MHRGGGEVQHQRDGEKRRQGESPAANQQDQGRHAADRRQQAGAVLFADRIGDRLAGVVDPEEDGQIAGRGQRREGFGEIRPLMRSRDVHLVDGAAAETDGQAAAEGRVEDDPAHPIPPRSPFPKHEGHREADGAGDEDRRIRQQHGQRHRHDQRPPPTPPARTPQPLDRERQQHERHEHVAAIGLGLGRVADQRIRDGEDADGQQDRRSLARAGRQGGETQTGCRSRTAANRAARNTRRTRRPGSTSSAPTNTAAARSE